VFGPAQSGWSAYIKLLMDDKGVGKAAIVGLDGALWGDKDLKVTAEEGKGNSHL
jgi:hypothetical protein